LVSVALGARLDDAGGFSGAAAGYRAHPCLLFPGFFALGFFIGFGSGLTFRMSAIASGKLSGYRLIRFDCLFT